MSDHTEHKKMGRPIIGKRKNNDMKFKMDDDMLSGLIEYCKERNITRAEGIRRAVGEMLEREHQKKPVDKK